ncbi:MAG: cyclopropane fatty acyl phospholipid synthase [Pseudomonadota bacterium]
MNFEKAVKELLKEVADIEINGNRPWDVQVHDKRVYRRVLHQQSLGLGESYMEGWWDSQQVDEVMARIIRSRLPQKIKQVKYLYPLLREKFNIVRAMAINYQNKKRARIVGEKHYDISNDLYRLMLDKRMIYSCAYWQSGSTTLDQAQEAKLKLICDKVGLKPGQKILDIGCGWGGFAKYAAENYGVEVVGITISEQQLKLGKEVCQGLPIELRLQDYRDLNEKFDHIISIGMFEHVGVKNYQTYMRAAYRCLKEDGLFLLHTIGNSDSVLKTDPWLHKYIFPNGVIPSIKQIGKAIEGLFVMEDLHNFGVDYEKTLLCWHDNFLKVWDEIKSKYDQRFYRMWTYYLLTCAGSFRARDMQLWQIVLSKHGLIGGYKSIR